MNLRVDLILESEQRSASVVSLKLLKRLAMIVVPALLILIAMFVMLGTMRMGAQVSNLEAQWKALEPQRDAAQAGIREIGRNAAIVKALDSWPATKLTLHDQLAAIMRLTPETMQITQMTYNQTIAVSARSRARTTTLRMQGKSKGLEEDEVEDRFAEKNIELMASLFRTEEPFATLLSSVNMRGFSDSSDGALPADRIFTLECEYHPRNFLP